MAAVTLVFPLAPGTSAPQKHGIGSPVERPVSAALQEGQVPSTLIRADKEDDIRSWADRMSDSEDEPMQYDGVSFSDSETDEDQSQTEMEEVSEKTKKFLQ